LPSASEGPGLRNDTAFGKVGVACPDWRVGGRAVALAPLVSPFQGCDEIIMTGRSRGGASRLTPRRSARGLICCCPFGAEEKQWHRPTLTSDPDHSRSEWTTLRRALLLAAGTPAGSKQWHRSYFTTDPTNGVTKNKLPHAEREGYFRQRHTECGLLLRTAAVLIGGRFGSRRDGREARRP
jgi:hypothetical protein